jgi:hypothetical protein
MQKLLLAQCTPRVSPPLVAPFLILCSWSFSIIFSVGTRSVHHWWLLNGWLHFPYCALDLFLLFFSLDQECTPLVATLRVVPTLCQKTVTITEYRYIGKCRGDNQIWRVWVPDIIYRMYRVVLPNNFLRHFSVKLWVRFEPLIPWLGSWHSTTEPTESFLNVSKITHFYYLFYTQ